MAGTIRSITSARRIGSPSGWVSFLPGALVLLLLAASAALGGAQAFDASHAGGPVTITAPWRFQTGDNPQWADPAFDDSQWPLLRMDKSWNVQGYGGYSGYAWYRIRLQLPVSKEQLAIGLDQVATSSEIYADGRPIGELGRMHPKPDWVGRLPRTITAIPLPPANGKEMVLAIRAWQSAKSAASFGAGAADLPSVGTGRAIRELESLGIHRALLSYLPDWTVAIVAAVIGLISFGLFMLRRSAMEYAWAALYLLGDAAVRWFDLYRQVHQIPTTDSAITLVAMRAVVTACWLFLVWGFMRAKADWLLRLGLVVAIIPTLFTLVVIGQLASIANSYVVRVLEVLCIGLLVFARLVRGAAQGNRDAQVFLVPFLLYSVTDAVRWIRGALFYAGFATTNSGLELYRGPYFTVTWDRVGFLLAFLAIGAALVRRFAQTAQQEQRLATEMESAREVQAQLVPRDFPRLAGFQIEAAYLPATEVGGDFYQVIPQSDGAVVMVIGDVCGKGLKAAMNGVLAIGAIRALASQELSPGLLLTRLNREMSGSQNGGFITCSCARVGSDGAVTLANAGHPPPYCNGEEMEMMSGLPLGITREVEYTETSARLAPGDRVTFLSDGVLEARDEDGGFFGFERTRAISGQRAEAIANAARQFGQEDDITVLTVAFRPAGSGLDQAVELGSASV